MKKHHVDIHGVRYQRDSVSFDYASNVYVDQYRDLTLLYKEYVGEELLNPCKIYTDMKNNYLIQVIDLRFQIDDINPKKTQLFKEYGGATNNARLFMI